ncbi:unnamed protein product [Mytilus edulis]|uniref:Uncharacterized protein n=1 Tax=Mytilus edulis TaxID=6550 RepID=A0A8S3PN31_MYTED|nr:unnamed protein product [Mytilus edulis]
MFAKNISNKKASYGEPVTNRQVMEEVYTEILTGMLLHTDILPPDVIDSGIVPSTVSMIRDGPWLKLSKLNRSLAQRVWDTAGTTIVRLLGTFSDKLINVLHIAKQCKDNKGTVCIEHSDNQEAISKMVDKKGLVDLSCIVDSEELDLIKSLLELLLCISLCSCKDFPDLTPKKNKSPHHMTSQGRSTRSDSSLGRPPLPKKLTRPSSAHHHRSLSPVKDVTRQSWVKENPYLTNTIDRPQSAVGANEAEHKMKVAFHYMSPEIANLIKGALGPDFAEVAMVKEEEEVKVEETHITDIEAVDRLNLCQTKKPIRPSSAPLVRTTAHSVPDVWDDIQERWQVEDKVCALLKSWKK